MNRVWWLDLGFGLLLGAFLMTIIFLVEFAAGWVNIREFFVTERFGQPSWLRSCCPFQAIYTSPARWATQTVEPLAERLGLPLIVEPDLQERRLGRGVFEHFFKAVEKTWLDPSFAHPGGETNAEAQSRGLGVIQRLLERHASAHVVLSTHGNLMALILKAFDPTIDFAFWKSLTMPDIFRIDRDLSGGVSVRRLWHDAMVA